MSSISAQVLEWHTANCNMHAHLCFLLLLLIIMILILVSCKQHLHSRLWIAHRNVIAIKAMYYSNFMKWIRINVLLQTLHSLPKPTSCPTTPKQFDGLPLSHYPDEDSMKQTYVCLTIEYQLQDARVVVSISRPGSMSQFLVDCMIRHLQRKISSARGKPCGASPDWEVLMLSTSQHANVPEKLMDIPYNCWNHPTSCPFHELKEKDEAVLLTYSPYLASAS